jgi:hypothetical protein
MEKKEMSAESLLESELEIIADCAKTFVDMMQRFNAKYNEVDEWVMEQCESNEKIKSSLQDITKVLEQLQ